MRSLSFVGVIALTLLPTAGRSASQPASVVVVYPLVASAGAPPNIGAVVARVLVAGMTAQGKVNAKFAPADTQQADYLAAARALGADYYVAGFVSSIGNEVSAVEQVVATKSGVVVWRNTAAYTVPEEARASGQQIRDAIVALNAPQFATSVAANDPAAAPPTTDAPAPAAPPPSRRATTPPPKPLPIPAADVDTDSGATSAPIDGPRFAIVNFGGPALDAVKHYLPASIIRTLPRYHMSGVQFDISTSEIAANGIVACAQTGADYVMGGSLAAAEDGDPGLGFSIGTDLILDVYSCRNIAGKPHVIEKQTSNGNMQTSVDIAVDQALKDLAASMKSATH
jgi:hypothetical protein